MRANNQPIILRPPLDPQSGLVRAPAPRTNWECLMCGAKFSEEANKDRHMTSCGSASNHNFRQPTRAALYPGALLALRHASCPQIPTHATQRPALVPPPVGKQQRVLLSVRLQLSQSEQVTYVGGAGERTSLPWHAPGACFRAQAELAPGQHAGSLLIHSTNTATDVKPFEVSSTPDSIPSVEIYCQNNGANNPSKPKPAVKPRPTSLNYEEGSKHLQPLTPGIVFGQKEKLKAEPEQAERAYDDGEIYANLGPLVENMRLKVELRQCQDRCGQLEGTNSALREDIEKNSKIIDDFKIKNKKLESEVAELRKLGNFENNHKPALLTASPRKPPLLPPSPGPRPSSRSPSRDTNK